MKTHRKILLAGSIVLVGGSLGLTLGYGLRIRSESYRRAVEADLSAFFEMPCDVGRIRPRSFQTRLFENVSIWLPDRRDRVFHCRQALWHEIERDGIETNELDLIDGVLALGTDRWQTTDYYQVFEAGLGHNLEDLDLTRVSLTDFELSFVRGGLGIRCRETSGTIDMSDPAEGVAQLHAYVLNGHRISQGVGIHARFSPKNGVEVSRLSLQLPEVPLSAIGLGDALGSDVTSGCFAGGIDYRNVDGQHEIRLRGDLSDVSLAEVTGRLPFGPLEGRLAVSVDEALISNSILTHLRGRGNVSDLSLQSFASLLGQPTLSGTADLNIQWIDLALGHINRLSIDGKAENLRLEQLLRPLGKGAATGKLTVQVKSLQIVDDVIESADIEISAVPPPGRAGTIDRTLLLNAAEKVANFSWPTWLPQSLLPDHVEYTEFGVRLLIRDNKLRVLGTHGSDGRTILTIKVGTTIPVVREWSGEIDLTPWIETALERARAYDPDRMRDWLDRH